MFLCIEFWYFMYIFAPISVMYKLLLEQMSQKPPLANPVITNKLTGLFILFTKYTTTTSQFNNIKEVGKSQRLWRTGVIERRHFQLRLQNDQQGIVWAVILFFYETMSQDERLHFTAGFKTLKPESQPAVSRALKKCFITPGFNSTFKPLATINSVCGDRSSGLRLWSHRRATN